MSNKLVVDLLNGQIAAALSRCESVAAVGHAGVRGAMREAVAISLIEPLLPPTWKLTSGIVASREGLNSRGAEGSDSGTEDQSGQEDLIIYDPSFLPPLFLLGDQEVVPVEAVVAIVEVKSTITASGWAQAIEHANLIRRMSSGWKPHKGLSPTLSQFTHPTYHVFALDTDLSGSGKSDWDRLLAAHKKLKTSIPVIHSFCVVNKEFGVQDYRRPNEFTNLVSNPISTATAKANLKEVSELLQESAVKEMVEPALKQIDKSLQHTDIRSWLVSFVDFLKAAHEVRTKKMSTPNLIEYMIDKN